MAVIVTKTFTTPCLGLLKADIDANVTITTNLEQIVYEGGATTDFYFATALSGPEDTELDSILGGWSCPPAPPETDEVVDDTDGPDVDTIWSSDKITTDFVNITGDTMTGALSISADEPNDFALYIQNTNVNGDGFAINAGENLGDIAFHIADWDDTFQIMELEADRGFATFGKTYAQTLSDNGVVYGIDNQHGGDAKDFNTQQGRYRVGGVPITVGSQVIRKFVFDACALDSPVNSNWAVNALAPASPDPANAGLIVRLFDDSTQEGVGFTLNIPTGAVNMTIRFKSRRRSAGSTQTVIPNLYRRSIPDNSTVTSWSSALSLTALSFPNNTNFQYDEQTITLATLGLTAGQTVQFELTRNPADTLSGDWALLQVEVEFS